MYELALFAGAGGGVLGGLLNGWQCIGAVECEGYPCGVLAARQNDGCLRPFPIWSDVRSFTSSNNACRRFIRTLRRVRRWLVISGGFPCQDISAAGKGEGITGARSGLWKDFARIVGEIRPRHVLVENSPVLTGRGLGVVLGDLAALGYDVQWGVLGAADAIWRDGDPCLDHERFRIWLWATLPDSAQGGWGPDRDGTEGVLDEAGHGWAAEGFCAAVPDGDGAGCARADVSQPAGRHAARQSAGTGAQNADADEAGRAQQRRAGAEATEHGAVEHGGAGNGKSGHAVCERRDQGREESDGEHVRTESATAGWWSSEPDVGRVADGVAHRVDRIAAISNGQVPAVVRMAWEILKR